jgi:hypothetical protein
MPQFSFARLQATCLNYYRLYSLDHDGHIVDVRAFEAGGDLAAIIAVGEAMPAEHRELWTGTRRVLELPRASSR